jgi:LysR family transcriptional regulator, hydrogen peroxide-inducible genes activator
LRFVEPQPARTVGLAWRRTSPRKRDFAALGEIVTEALELPKIRSAIRETTRRQAHA